VRPSAFKENSIRHGKQQRRAGADEHAAGQIRGAGSAKSPPQFTAPQLGCKRARRDREHQHRCAKSAKAFLSDKERPRKLHGE